MEHDEKPNYGLTRPGGHGWVGDDINAWEYRAVAAAAVAIAAVLAIIAAGGIWMLWRLVFG